MSDKIIKTETSQSSIESLRLLLTVDTDDVLSITKTGVKDGAKGLLARGISVIQRLNEVRFGEALLRELEEMRSAGAIRDDFTRTDAGLETLREFFEMIDGKPDEARFHAFCALFMSANSSEAGESEAILDIELMGILRRLSAAEMHLLSALLKIEKYIIGHEKSLMQAIADELGFHSDALVRKNIGALIDGSLIDGEVWRNLGGTHGTEKILLTDLGFALRDRVRRYNEFKAKTQPQD